MIQAIREHLPNFILKLYQKRLHDPNAEITEEELFEAYQQLWEQIQFQDYKLQLLKNQADMLERMIEKKSLYTTGNKIFGL